MSVKNTLNLLNFFLSKNNSRLKLVRIPYLQFERLRSYRYDAKSGF